MELHYIMWQLRIVLAYFSFTTFRCLHIPISGRDFLSGGSFQPGERRFGKIFKPDSVHFDKIVVNKATNFKMIFPPYPDVLCIAHNIVVVLGEEAQIQAT